MVVGVASMVRRIPPPVFEELSPRRDADYLLVCKDYSQVLRYLEGKRAYVNW